MSILDKQEAQAVLKRIGDWLDGTPDGTFNASEFRQRIVKEIAVIEGIPGQVVNKYTELKADFAQHPAVWFWRGACGGMIVGASIIAPIAYGVIRAVARGLGIPFA